MRRSSRIHEKVQPRLPVEVQLSIARQAGLILHDSGTPADKQQMTQLCLVSPIWKSEVQSVLYHTVACFSRSFRKLSPHIRPRSSIGQHIHEIDLKGDLSESAAIIERLRLLPALRRINDLAWTDAVAAIKPPPRSARLALDALSLAQASTAAAAQLEQFFDLSTLQSFGLVFSRGWIGPIDLSVLALVPAGIRALKLQHVRPQVVAAVPDAIRRFANLVSLTVVLSSAVDALSIRLPTLPRLVDLTISLKGTPHALDTGQPSLQRLILEQRNSELRLRHARSLPAQARDACRILTTTSAGLFPALRSIAITCDFSIIVDLHPHDLSLEGVAGLAQAMSAAGLRFVDRTGVEWREEWEQRPEAGQA